MMDSILRSLKNINVLEVRSPHPAPDPGFVMGGGPIFEKKSDKQKRKKRGKKGHQHFRGAFLLQNFLKRKEKISRVFFVFG